MQFTDTHAHYFDWKFDALPGGAQGVLNDPAFRASVRAVINIGTNLQNSREAVAQAARYPFMAAAVGIHPEDCQVYPGAPGWYEGQKPLEPEEELPRLRAWLGGATRLLRSGKSGWIAIGSRWTARASRLSLTVSWRWRSSWICLSSSTTARRTARVWMPFAATRAYAACFTASPDRRKRQKSLSGADFS